MPKCMVTFTSLTGVPSNGSFFIRAKWGRDGFWCQNPHITQNTKKDANGTNVWSETIVIQSKFDWKKDALVMHVYESGIFTNTHVGDSVIQFNQLVLNQQTPVCLPLTQRLGAVVVAGKLNVQVKALDFGHELIQVAPQPPQFTPHYFVASSLPLSSGLGPSDATMPSSTVSLGPGQQVYIQPLGSITNPSNNYLPSGINVQAPLTTMPTANGGFMFYTMPQGPSHSSAPAPSEPAPSYASLDQYTADFTYEAPSAPTATIVPSQHGHIDEQSPPPISNASPPPYAYHGESLI